MAYVQLQNSLVRNRMTDGRTNDGKISTVEDTTTSDDAWDVLLRLAGSGMVYDFGRPDKSTSSTSKCGDRSDDRRICGVDGT